MDQHRTQGLAKVAAERTEGLAGCVELNIGGYRFKTSVPSLRRVPHTFFDAYFSGRYAQDVCGDGRHLRGPGRRALRPRP